MKTYRLFAGVVILALILIAAVAIYRPLYVSIIEPTPTSTPATPPPSIFVYIVEIECNYSFTSISEDVAIVTPMSGERTFHTFENAKKYIKMKLDELQAAADNEKLDDCERTYTGSYKIIEYDEEYSEKQILETGNFSIRRSIDK